MSATDGFKTSASGSFGLSAMQHSISLADTKAGAVLAASLALILSSLLALGDLARPLPVCSPAHTLLIVAIVLLLAAGACAFWTVRPRARVLASRSIFYFRSTALAQADGKTPPDISDLDEGALLDLQLRHIADLGRIAREKFAALAPALWLFAGGATAFLVGQALRLLV